ncbi:MAG: hypothetical protein AAF602_29070 [Myxococcota bacterium]
MARSLYSRNEEVGAIAELVWQLCQEARFRCPNPNCGKWMVADPSYVVAIDEHADESPSNLLLLCPACFRNHHRGQIPTHAFRAWKSVLVADRSPYDIDHLTFLQFLETLGEPLVLSTTQLLELKDLVVAGAISTDALEGDPPQWRVEMTVAGTLLLESWRLGRAPDA